MFSLRKTSGHAAVVLEKVWFLCLRVNGGEWVGPSLMGHVATERGSGGGISQRPGA